MNAKTIGYVGLGIMGLPMAKNLLDAGYPVVGHNRSREPVDELVEYGGDGAGTPREAAAKADVVITCLPDSETVEEVALGDDGVAAGLDDGEAVIDMSTISPPVAEEVANRLAEQDVHFMDAPVSGGESGAVEGTLSIMVGGDEDVVDDHDDVFETLGETITHCGEPGTGQITKACNQLVVSGMIEVLAEGLVFAHQAGADPATVYDAISGGSCRGFVMDHHGSHMVEGDHEPGFYSSYMYKDLSYAIEAAQEYGAPVPTAAVTHELYKSTVESGHGQEKNTAVIKVLENMVGGVDVASGD